MLWLEYLPPLLPTIPGDLCYSGEQREPQKTRLTISRAGQGRLSQGGGDTGAGN